MKRIFLFLCVIVLFAFSCRWKNHRQITGNGVIAVEDRHIGHATHIRLKASFDVEIIQGNNTSVNVEGDNNILPYVLIREENGVLVIDSKDNLNYSSEHGIKVTVITDKLEAVDLVGSGNVTGKGKFIGVDKIKLNIAGSGDIRIDINAPRVDANIAGSGSITVNGETQDQHISIAGSGNYNADGLKSESTTANIAGNGDAKVFADINLDVNIAGSGSVYYKGSPSIKQKILGSGEVKKAND